MPRSCEAFGGRTARRLLPGSQRLARRPMPARSHNVSPLRPRAARGAATEGLDIAVIGVGYVGLVTATCMASFGHRVSAFDIDADKIEALQRAHVPIHEAGLAELLAEQVGAARL